MDVREGREGLCVGEPSPIRGRVMASHDPAPYGARLATTSNREVNMTTNRRAQIEAMLADDPNDPELRYMLAMEHISAGEDAGAVACFEELIRRTPDYAPAYHMGARTLERLNRVVDAKDLLRRGIPAALAKGDQHAAGEMQQLLDLLD